MYNSILLLRPTPDYIIMSNTVISILYNNIILLRPTPDYIIMSNTVISTLLPSSSVLK